MRATTPTRSVSLGLALASLVVVTACSSDKVKVAPPDELYRSATQDFVDGNYGISIETYKYLLDHYPLDDRAEEVELRIAEAHFADEAYPESIAAFADFQRMHPTSPRLPEVEYNIGKAYMAQMDTIDRDLNAAANAHARFESVIARYPDSEYANRARAELRQVREHLASRELYVARFYLGRGNDGAGRTRVATLLATYPETSAARKAIALVGDDARSAGDEDLAQLADAAYAATEGNDTDEVKDGTVAPRRPTPGGPVDALRVRLSPHAVASPAQPTQPSTAKPRAEQPLL
jgi:outer membrane protein assembly factor BamD